jgi:dTDP-4-amino-4,6-dideoxygalactose transaminase
MSGFLLRNDQVARANVIDNVSHLENTRRGVPDAENVMSIDPNVIDSVPLSDPRGESASLRAEISASLMRVVDSGSYILGAEVAAFERALAANIRVAEAVGVASGTDALVLAMLGVGVSAGDEVMTVSHTAGPTAAAIRMIGAIPVLIDVEECSYCIDPNKIESAIGPRTRAIVAVHLYGHPANMATINSIASQRRISVIEDCAQAQGATIGERQVGSFGNIACFSFYPTKILAAIGDGGALVTNDIALADRVRKLRTYGWSKPQYAALENGRCSRLDEIQAAILSLKLQMLSTNLKRRRNVAERYRSHLAGLPLVIPSERAGCGHSYHLFVIRAEARDALEAHLRASAIGTGRHYPWPVHVQPGIASCARVPEPLAVTERIAAEILSLPMFATISDTQIDRVIDAVWKFYR